MADQKTPGTPPSTGSEEDEDNLREKPTLKAADLVKAMRDQNATTNDSQGAEPSTTLFDPEDPEAPPLVLSSVEPPERPSGEARVLQDPKTLRHIRELATTRQSRETVEEAVLAALRGEPYDKKNLPDPRICFVGMARVLGEHGISAESATKAIIEALDDA